MFLRMPSSQLTTLTAGIASGALTELQVLPGGAATPGLQLIRVLGVQDRTPAAVSASSAQVALMVNTSTGFVTPPAGFIDPLWLQIAERWLPYVLGISASLVPTANAVLALSTESIVDARGAWQTLLQSLGWIQQTPTLSGPTPSLSG